LHSEKNVVMKKENEYTFVTIDDSNEDIMSDAVVIDVDSDSEIFAAVSIDNDVEMSDFITLADDTIMLSDADMTDIYSVDIDDTDISLII
jgi:hypothetical protein